MQRTSPWTGTVISMPSKSIQNDLDLYLAQISRVPLLTADQEKQLAWRIINDGCDTAKEHMIRANLRLVVSISKQFTRSGVPLLELINEGNLGLIRAVERFDPAYGNRFSTYATWWIKKTIKRKIMNGRQAMHIPSYMLQRMANWNRTLRELEDALGRSPTPSELADAMQVPRSKLGLIQRTMAAVQRSSTSGPREEPSRSHPLDGFADPGGGRDEIEHRDELRKVRGLLEGLDSVTSDIIRMRFGLDGHEPMTLKEIGTHLGLTRERVRQIEHQALGQLLRGFSHRHLDQRTSRAG